MAQLTFIACILLCGNKVATFENDIQKVFFFMQLRNSPEHNDTIKLNEKEKRNFFFYFIRTDTVRDLITHSKNIRNCKNCFTVKNFILIIFFYPIWKRNCH